MPAGEAGGEDLAGAEEPAAGEESPLLAVPPGSRDSPRLTPRSKGKVYYPVKSDKRASGARTRSYASKYSKEKSSATMRNIMPGIQDIGSIAKMGGLGTGIYEQDESIYNLREQTEENKLFKINESVRNLLKSLEDNKKTTTEQKDENKAQ
jgi:hypothetical protein